MRRGFQTALLQWAVALLVFVLAWGLLAWVAAKLTHMSFGWQSPSAFLTLAAGAALSAAYSAVSTMRWMSRWPDARPRVDRDIAAGLVTEEHVEFEAVKRFQEPEHGGLIYFLRTSDERVFVLYDHESQDLGVQSQDPLGSRFRPRVHFRLVRAPSSRFVLSRSFSGPVLELHDPVELTASPGQWPETDEFCEIRWDELESRLGRKEHC